MELAPVLSERFPGPVAQVFGDIETNGLLGEGVPVSIVEICLVAIHYPSGVKSKVQPKVRADGCVRCVCAWLGGACAHHHHLLSAGCLCKD
jgi:hypothetical protein